MKSTSTLYNYDQGTDKDILVDGKPLFMKEFIKGIHTIQQRNLIPNSVFKNFKLNVIVIQRVLSNLECNSCAFEEQSASPTCRAKFDHLQLL